ncbi:MAG: IS1096 element passenger TnpR family protein [Flavobacteriales bacterium]
MGKILKLRVILDAEDDVFRDIEIAVDAPLVHLHAATLDAFGWEGMELASFYKSNDQWDRGEEIPLMAMPDGPGTIDMESMRVADLLPDPGAKAVYVYDFLRMWCFYVEPVAWIEPEENAGYPRLVMEFGQPPAPESRAPEGVSDADFLAALGMDEGPGSHGHSTGDDESEGPEFTNLDDLDDIY